MLQRSRKLIQNVLLSLILITLITSCSSVKKLEIFKTEVEREHLDLEKPTLGQMEDIRWHIITSENAEEVFKKLQEDGIDPVLFGLTDKDYEMLAKNFAQIRAHMMKMNNIIDEYKEYYESEEEGTNEK